MKVLTRIRTDHPEIADALHMKSGLNPDRPSLKPFDQLSASDRASLLPGFGKIGHLFEDADAKHDTAFIEEFSRRERLSAQALIETILERL